MTMAMRIHAHGGPEVMQWEEAAIPPPAAGEARIRHTAIGVNFSDVNVRRGGFYIGDPPPMPLIPGNEAAGIVEALGPGVNSVSVGDRVVYAGMSAAFFEKTGAYVEHRNVPVERLLSLPEGVSDRQAAGLMVKGLTASSIINRIWRPQAGDPVLIHAAASGVGSILAQWCKHLGATVIGTVGSPAKAAIAREYGCDHTILYREVDFAPAVKAIAPRGVAAVLDGVGKDTFMASLDCTRPYGILVNYGNASGHPPPLDLMLLSKKGSLCVSRPALSSHIGDVGSMRRAAAELFGLVADGHIRVQVSKTYALRDAVEAHRDLEAGANTGSVLLIP